MSPGSWRHRADNMRVSRGQIDGRVNLLAPQFSPLWPPSWLPLCSSQFIFHNLNTAGQVRWMLGVSLNYYYKFCSQIEVPEHSNCRLVPYWREFLGVSGSRTWSDTPFANTYVSPAGAQPTELPRPTILHCQSSDELYRLLADQWCSSRFVYFNEKFCKILWNNAERKTTII